MVEQGTENPRVVGSIPTGGICGFSSSGRAPPCQGGGSGFEPRNPLSRFGNILSENEIPDRLCPGFSIARKMQTADAFLTSANP